MTSTADPAQGAETPEAADPIGPATGAPAQAVEITEASEALSGGELLSRTAVIVVSYDSAKLLERTLAHVAEDSPEARIIVVDNYSTPAAREELVALASSRGWEAVLPETNTGFGGGMNLGAARARELGADLLVLLNPDAVIARADLIR
ncbi:glycosyltransferase family 2 protein, partial [Actinomyces oris]